MTEPTDEEIRIYYEELKANSNQVSRDNSSRPARVIPPATLAGNIDFLTKEQKQELERKEKIKKEREALVLKDYENKLEENEIIKKKYKHPVLINYNYVLFLKIAFILSLLVIAIVFLYMVDKEKFKDIVNNVINIPERNVSVNIINNMSASVDPTNNYYNNFTIVNKICLNGSSQC